MAVAQTAPHMAADMLCCLGLGFLLGAVYDLARFLAGDSRPVCFVADLAAFVLAALLLTSFAAGRSWAGAVRWYMSASLLFGDAGYFLVLAPATRAVEDFIKWLLSRPFVLTGMLLCPIGRAVGRAACRRTGKMREKVRTNRAKRLQKNAKVLYNSN